ncbi:putative ankyrin-repeat protein [Cryptotrichosporon argae]
MMSLTPGGPLVPPSPVIDHFPSPDTRAVEAGSSSHPVATLYAPSPESVLPLLRAADSEVRAATILRYAIRWAAEHGDAELISWLASLTGEWATLLDAEVRTLDDEDGWGLVGMAIQASCGRQDKEEAVRAVVVRWGLDTGPRGGRDRAGWTPLHLAALIASPPLVSFLLNRGATPIALTARGLTPSDLITGMDERDVLLPLLEHDPSRRESLDAKRAAGAGGGDDHLTARYEQSLSASRRRMLERRRAQAVARAERDERRSAQSKRREEYERVVREAAKIVGVEPDGLMKPESDDEEEEQDDDEEEDTNALLVFSLPALPALLDALIATYPPTCFPLARRAVPANALFLYARFAYYRCDETWLEELLEGAVEKIEAGVYNNVDDLSYLAFWAYNSTLLLHLINTDEPLRQACEEMKLLGMLEELINAIHVFIIRIAERKIDTVLDAALLDYETLEDFDDVRFEGEWSLFRSLGKKSKAPLRELDGMSASSSTLRKRDSQSSLLGPTSGAAGSLLGTLKGKSPLRSMGRPQSLSDLRGAAKAAKAASQEAIADGLASAQAALGRGTDPRKITNILSSVLLVLQLYQVNPAFVVQVFSQAFYWVSCELFNRILTRKKYLCRSKAVQIRINVAAIEDWTTAHGLPPRVAGRHLEPVNQLLQWLQSASGVRDFDTLIGTMQSLRSVNPLQMRRAVRDYRYEVNEGRMSDECAQYLAQLQKDWERRRIQLGVSGFGDAAEPDAQRAGLDEATPIDALFDDSVALADFVPQSAPECLGELLDSRFMLPFLLPTDNSYLVAVPPADSLSGPLALAVPDSPYVDTSRPSSTRSSFSSARPMGWAAPPPHTLRRLPDDFFVWLKTVAVPRRVDWDAMRARQQSRREEREAIDAAEVDAHLGGADTRRRFDRETTPMPGSGLPVLNEDDRETTPTASTITVRAEPGSPSARGLSSWNEPSNAPKWFPPAAERARARPAQGANAASTSGGRGVPSGQVSPATTTQTHRPFAETPRPPTPAGSARTASLSAAPADYSAVVDLSPSMDSEPYGPPSTPPRRVPQLPRPAGNEPYQSRFESPYAGGEAYGSRFDSNLDHRDPGSGSGRYESSDVRLREAANSLRDSGASDLSCHGSHGSHGSPAPNPTSPGPHYELARHRRARVHSGASASDAGTKTSRNGSGGSGSPVLSPKSPASSFSSDGSKRKWWKVGRQVTG